MWAPLPLSSPVPVPIHLQAISPWHLPLFDSGYGFFLLHGAHTGSQAFSIVMSLQKTTSFLFALFLISVASTKVLHLALHLGTIPLAAFFLFLPTFFIPDVALLIIIRLLLRRERGVGSLVGLLLGSFISYVKPSVKPSWPRPQLPHAPSWQARLKPRTDVSHLLQHHANSDSLLGRARTSSGPRPAQSRRTKMESLSS